MRKLWSLLSLMVICSLAVTACGEAEGNNENPADASSDASSDSQEAKSYTGMDGDVADLEYSVVTIKKLDGSLVEIDINGLAVEEVKGAQKNDAGDWEIIDRRGVRFGTIFEKGNITAEDVMPVTFVCRDGYDVYRTKLKNDSSKLPQFKWLSEKGYVYLGSGGNKDPLYPLHEGKALNVDYDLAADSEVPEAIGTSVSALSNLRAKMIEKVDDETYGVVEFIEAE